MEKETNYEIASDNFENAFNEDAELFINNMRESFRKSMLDELEYFRTNGIWKSDTPEYKFNSHLKFAKSECGKICFVHNETMIAYKTSDYPNFKMQGEYPNFEIDELFVFERWCTSFDM